MPSSAFDHGLRPPDRGVELYELNDVDDGDIVLTGTFAAQVFGSDISSPGELTVDEMLAWARTHFDDISITVGSDVYSAGTVASQGATKVWPASGMECRRRYSYEPAGSTIYTTWWVEFCFEDRLSLAGMLEAFRRDERVVDVAPSADDPSTAECCIRPLHGKSVDGTALEVVSDARPAIDAAAVAAVLAEAEPASLRLSYANGVSIGAIRPGPV